VIEPAPARVANQDSQVMGHISTRFSFVTESLSLIGTSFCDRENPAVRLSDCEPHPIL
jgi:hypothetical protein